ncbi:MAG: 4Fe-4S binding protein, partial [Deltaproteobacteria bacterium]|nr:4Fe-4S binding protein [Deltaproteobacteria bacterium]
MGRSRWFKSDVAGPSGESAVLNAAQTLAVMEARIAETLAHSLTNETEDAGRTLGVYWREAMAQGRHNALGETLHRVSVSNGAEALAALLGLGLSGRRGTALLTAEDLLRARGTLVATAAQGVPLVLHALLHPQGTTGAHDAWHALEGSGWMQFLAPDAQGVADLAVVARRCAEEVLLPALVGQDVWSSGCMEPVRLPEESMVRSFLGRPGEHIPVPTPAQGLVFGEERRRLPQRWSVDHPAGGALETPAGVTSRAAAARAVYLMEDLEGHIARVMAGYATLTGHPLQPVHMMHNDSADWLVLTLGAATGSVLAAAQALGEKGFKGKRVGVAALVQWRPFPARRVAELLAGRKGVLIVEPAGGFPDQDGPVLREVRSALHGCLENGLARRGALPYPGLPALTRLPSLYSALTPAGGEGVSPRAVAAAILAMQNGVGAPRRVFLEVPFLWERPETPKEELLQQALLDTYPHAGRQGLSASEALPATPGLLTVRILARQGHTPFFPGEHPAALLAELSGLQVKAWRQPAGLTGVLGSGTLETSWLLACPRSPVSLAQAKALSANALPEAVDLLLCADAAALTVPGILAGLKPQGTILAQGTPAESAALWASLPPPVKHALVSGQARLLLVDAETPVRAEAIAPEEQRQFSGRVWLGALLALPEVAALTGLSGKPLQRALRSVLTPLHEDVHEEGQGHGQTAVDAHLALIEAGLSACIPLSIPQEGPAGTSQPPLGFSRPSQSPASLVPDVLKHRASGTVPALDLHRFWETLVEPMTARGVASLLAEPFLTSGLSPASGGLLTTQYLAGVALPRWVPERCTGCGACWTLCPDGALPVRVNPPGEVLQMAQARLKSQGGTAEHLLRALRQMEGHWRDLIVAAGTGHEAGAVLDEAAARTLAGSRLTGEDKKALEGELAPLLRMLRPLKLAVTAPFFSAPETSARNSGGLLSLVLDPDRCTGCGACVAACAEQALGTAPLLEADLGVQRDARDIQRRLPDTPMPFLTAPQAGETPGL